MQTGLKEKIKIIFALVKRDYAIQFAGSILGILWVLIQNLVMIAVYTVVFIFLNLKNSSTQPEYIPYIFSGLLFWLPINDFIIRGTSILTENRHLIKRSPLGSDFFLWVPYFQFLIHMFVTSIPVFVLLYFFSGLSRWFFLVYPFILFFGLYLQMLVHYLARANIILKDISPVIRLFSQFFFWTLPVLYYPVNPLLYQLNWWNPLNYPLEIFRMILLNNYSPRFSPLPFVIYIIVFFIIFQLSKNRFNDLVSDHL